MFAFGFGVRRSDKQGVLDIYYPKPFTNFEKPRALKGFTNIITNCLGYKGGNQVLEIDNIYHLIETLRKKNHNGSADQLESMAHEGNNIILTMLKEDKPPTTIEEIYLKLHMLSHRQHKPNSMNLDGMFGILPNIAWTNHGPIRASKINDEITRYRLTSFENLRVYSVDKFPIMTDYVVPSNVRIVNTANVRLGAYLGEGTTLMTGGAINFNAGTLGSGMIEGRISAGVTIGNGSDLGGGSSTMGTLSGGGDIKITVGEGCLIGANAGTGIPLGNGCIIEAGLYITSGMKILDLRILGPGDQHVKPLTRKGMEFANINNITFFRDSKSGEVKAMPNKPNSVELNDELHQND
jgi:2,3,4,5-tetrahydropyridine-2,6-dicarboxylate N-succinyltransferase